MASRRRRRDESVVDFVQEMKAIGRQTNMAERDVVGYIVQGMTEDPTVRLIMRTARTYNDLSDRLENADDILKRFRETGSGGGQRAGTAETEQDKRQSPESGDHQDGRDVGFDGEETS